MHSKSEPTGISSSWFATCLNEVSFSLQFLFVFLSNFPYHLTFHCFVSSNLVGNQLCKVMNWLEVIGLVFFCKVGSKDVFLSPKHFFQKDFDCFKLLQI